MEHLRQTSCSVRGNKLQLFSSSTLCIYVASQFFFLDIAASLWAEKNELLAGF